LNVEHLIGDEPFIYTWSDDFIVSEPSRFKQMIAAYDEYQSSILCAISAKDEADYRRYGFAGGKEIKPGIIDVETIVEKPGSREQSPSNLATVSGFLFTPDIFGYLHQAQEEMQDGTELYWNDGLKLMLADGKRVLAYEAPGGRYYDAGDKLEYLKTVVDFALGRDDIAPEFKEFLKGRVL
jgi:UTP--glucose-1-phosphate uridylyltransferase